MLDRPWEKADYQVADQISDYWVNFIKTGDPNGEGLPEWTASDSNKMVTQRLGTEIGPMPIAGEKQTEFFIEMLLFYALF